VEVRFVDRRLSRLPRPWGTVASWLLTIACSAVVVLVFQAEVAKPFRIPSSSMEPALHCARPSGGCEAEFSDRVLACEICLRFESPKRGQIVVFHAPALAKQRCGEGGDYVKRLIGMPGDLLSENGQGYISINGRLLNEPYITASARAADTDFRGHSWRVPAHEYFMMGDNRGDSCDSRQWGAVPRSELIGVVFATYWPPNRMSVR
jgi:signal peptidase I